MNTRSSTRHELAEPFPSDWWEEVLQLTQYGSLALKADEFRDNTIEVDTEDRNKNNRSKLTQELKGMNITDQIKPGRYYILRLRSNDQKWIGRWVAKITDAAKEQMNTDQHVAYDFSLGESEDITSSTLGLREMADMMNRNGGHWPKLVAERRKAYREYNKLDKVVP